MSAKISEIEAMLAAGPEDSLRWDTLPGAINRGEIELTVRLLTERFDKDAFIFGKTRKGRARAVSRQEEVQIW